MRVLGLASLSLLLGAAAQASEGAAYLKIPQGAASTAMGSAQVALRGVESLWYTPAGLAELKGPQVGLSRMAWLGQTRNDYLGLALPVGQKGGVGAWLNYIGSEDVYRDAQGADYGSFGVYALNGGLAYGVSLGSLALGVAGKYYQERVEQLTSSNWAGDVGLQLNLGTPRARLGLAAQNLGPNLNYDRTLGDVRPPITYRAGIALDRVAGFLSIVQELRMLPESGETSYLAGGEIQGRTGLLTLAGRAGYESAAGAIGGGLAGMTLGVGVAVDQLRVDFAYVPYGPLGNPYRMTLGWQFESAKKPKPAAAPVPPRPAPVAQVTPQPPAQPAQAAVTVELPQGVEVLGKPKTFSSPARAWEAAKTAESIGDFEQARSAYEAATRMDAYNPEAWGRLGKFEYGQGNKAAALKAFEGMQKLKPDPNFDAWLKQYRESL